MTLENQDILQQRKATILSILEDLFGKWELAEWLHALISSPFASEESISGVESLLSDSFKTMEENETRFLLQKSLERLNSMKQQEAQEKANDQVFAEQILQYN